MNVLRPLTRNPGFAAVTILTLALGIGASTAIFSVVHAILIHPFPYPDSDRILFVSGALRSEPEGGQSINFVDLGDWRRQSAEFESLGGTQDAQLAVTGVAEPARIKGAYVTSEVLPLLGIAPSLGRLLTAADDQPGAAKVCVLADRAWERFFQRRPDIIGQSIQLDGQPYQVVGVMPSSFKYWDAWAYVPLAHGMPPEFRNQRGATLGLWGIGRLKAGSTVERARKELEGIARRLEEAYPVENRDRTVRVRLLAETVGGQIRPQLQLLLGAVACVLLIACVNVANLLLARGTSRERELSVRAALGADRGHLVRQLLGEVMPIAFGSALAGTAMAWAGLRFLLALIPSEMIPAEADIRLSVPVLAFAVGLALVSALLAGLLPAFESARLATRGGLREGRSQTAGRRQSRAQSLLVIAEVALALTLLVGAGMLIRNLVRIARTDPGFRASHLVVANVQLPESRYRGPLAGLNFFRNLEERIRRVPGVRDMGAMNSTPLSGGNVSLPLLVAGRDNSKPENLHSPVYNAVTPRAMEAMGLRLISGRKFEASDRDGAERVVILSESSARKTFGAEDPLGRQVACGVTDAMVGDHPAEGMMARILNPPWARVIGVVADTRHYGLAGDPVPQAYFPYEQSFDIAPIRNAFGILVRTEGDPSALVATLRRELRDVDPDLPLDSVRTMESVVSDSLRGQRFVVVLLGVFAGVALILAAVGIYSVVAWLVAQRTREMGIRLALGAGPGSVVQLMVGRGIAPVLIGLLVGGVLAVVLGRLLTGTLVEMKSIDASTLLSVSGLMAAVALLACWFPARRAARIDPIIALRSE
ncbi:MAG: ABC transporter permease [Verrucomicrobiota bacterium]